MLSKKNKKKQYKNRDYLYYCCKELRRCLSACSLTGTSFIVTLLSIGLALIYFFLEPNNYPIPSVVWLFLGTLLGWVLHATTDGGRVFICRRSFSGGYKELDYMLLNVRCNTSWMNLGYWKARNGDPKDDPTSYAEACENMVTLVGEHADLSNKDKLLDVGFGRGDQLEIWRKIFNVQYICGINLSSAEVEFARAKLSKYVSRSSNISSPNTSPSASRRSKSRVDKVVHISQGSGTDIDFNDETFSKVVSVDSAYHYTKRVDFMSEAYRVLKPGGKLCVADICLPKAPSTFLGIFFLRLLCTISGIPRSNMCDETTYLKHLKQTGFINAKIVEHLDNDVFIGWSTFMRKHKYEFGPLFQPSVFSTYSACASMFDFIGRMHLLSFIVIVAEKESDNKTSDGIIQNNSGISKSPPTINRMKSASAIHHFA